GEWITNRLMKVALKLLVENLRYTVPKQDLSVSLARIPTLPKSGMIIAPLSYSAS
ncbi:MAG: cytochrome P450, partial [Methylophilus methylotrophus]